jgi:serine phosphatase RsbU (regulator of sigma subunit)
MLGIASTYEEMGELAKAYEYYGEGMRDSDKRCALQCELGIGRIYCLQGETLKAEEVLTNALLIAKDLSANGLIADIYLALSTLYETLNNPGKAFETYKLYQKAKEEVLNEEAKNRLKNIEISYAIEKSEREKEIFRLRNVELKAAYDIIDEKNKEITSSINYARYIQEAILPQPQEVTWLASRMFILYIPKDIVSGDFYWFTEKDGKTIVVAADCTGHGVPGALMSMLGISLLEEIVNKRGIVNADEILNNLRVEVIRSLKQEGVDSKSKDGMDISLVVIDNAKSVAQFAGAYNSLYLVRNGELMEYKADKMPIAIHHKMDSLFTNHSFELKTNDMLYICSDGFQDQFGGSEGKKFMTKNLKSLFSEVSLLPIESQKEELLKQYQSWKGDYEQVDDVVVVGIKIE